MRRTNVKTIEEHSAGGVLFRPKEGGFEACLILVRSPRGRFRWQLPKGHVEREELAKEAATREILEETGCQGKVVADLGNCEFSYTRRAIDGWRRVKKRVDFYLLSYESGSVHDHDNEVEQARFVNVREAERLLAFESEKDAMRRALEILEDAGMRKWDLITPTPSK
jgi:8-oxo-dGTP pyrophosphatase MutT (NUDIX family)